MENWDAQVFDLAAERISRRSSWDDFPSYEEYAETNRRGELYRQDHLDTLAKAEFHPIESGVWQRDFGDGQTHHISYGPGARTNGRLTPWFFSAGEDEIAQPHATLASALKTADAHRETMMRQASAFPNWTVHIGGLA
jgi:phenylalanyl-tRNA synthetase alpha subunit